MPGEKLRLVEEYMTEEVARWRVECFTAGLGESYIGCKLKVAVECGPQCRE